MSAPIGVIISDIHFTLKTNEVATKAFLAAKNKALELGVPLYILGDTLDTKAIMRAECVNALLNALSTPNPPIFTLVGNHELVNEKGTDHTLQFLAPYMTVVDAPARLNSTNPQVYGIPYMSSPEAFAECLATIPEDAVLLIHQGVREADMGHYVQDLSALPSQVFGSRLVISGHYHKRQTCGQVVFVGNPYTLGAAEADHGAKGYHILHQNKTLTFVPLNIRKHVVINHTVGNPLPKVTTMPGDIVTVKLHGSKAQLAAVKKAELGTQLLGRTDFTLISIPTEQVYDAPSLPVTTSPTELLDNLIDSMRESNEYKTTLKHTWRSLLYETD